MVDFLAKKHIQRKSAIKQTLAISCVFKFRLHSVPIRTIFNFEIIACENGNASYSVTRTHAPNRFP